MAKKQQGEGALSFKKSLRRNWDLYLLILPILVFFFVFSYMPMYGIVIAFKDYIAAKGIWGSPWVGFAHFQRFFESIYFERTIKNTLGISLYSLIVGFPMPILLALMINEVHHLPFKRTVQTVTYAPYFISQVVMCGMIIIFIRPDAGFINMLLKAMGQEQIAFIIEPAWFKTIYVWSGVWQNTGWGTIIYIAALSGLDQQMYEAAQIDGANKIQKIWHITLPCLMPTAILLLIMNCGSLMSVGFEKVFLLQTPLNMEASDVISTYTYRAGMIDANYSYSAAIGLFNSVINFVILFIVNQISKRVSSISLF
ncbi:MAG: sugar ABC transporter permease [Oscillospiraceae bacterium]|jgi:putative aldouronate transport system permease protein|nr:sugar ABC transporter permease [Oscillospiraceae bacterium]